MKKITGDRAVEQKHLHIRGENNSMNVTIIFVIETPPHTWRKSAQDAKKINEFRNTSTYVEKMNHQDYHARPS